MRRGAVDGREAGVGFAEDEIEIGAREHNRLNAVTLAEGGRDLAQTGFVLWRADPLLRKVQVDAMDLVDLAVLRTHDVHVIKRAEQSAVDGELGPEQCHPCQATIAQMLRGDIQDIDQWQ